MTSQAPEARPASVLPRARLERRFGSEVVLLTGFPAPRALAMLAVLLAREPDAEIWLVVPREQEQAARAALAAQPAAAERARLMLGEPCAIDLGLSRASYRELVERVDRWFALYQTVDPRTGRELALRVNLGSAREIAELSRVAERLSHVTFVSSASVFGNHEGAVSEEDFALGQSFRAPAEEALARAESLLRRKLESAPWSIVRTPQVLGDRQTGRVARATGLYLLLSLMANAPSDAPLPLPPGASRPVHVLPADFLAEALYAVSVLGTRGHVYHFADSDPPPLSSVLEQAATHFGKRLERSFDPRAIGRLLLQSPGFWLSQQSSRALSGWAESAAVLLTRAGDRLLERAAMTVPGLLSYLPVVLGEVQAQLREQRLELPPQRTPFEAVS